MKVHHWSLLVLACLVMGMSAGVAAEEEKPAKPKKAEASETAQKQREAPEAKRKPVKSGEIVLDRPSPIYVDVHNGQVFVVARINPSDLDNDSAVLCTIIASDGNGGPWQEPLQFIGPDDEFGAFI